VGAAFAAGAGIARADLDVGVPPGTPLDWVSGLPRRIPTGNVRIPTGVTEPEKPKDDGQPKTISRDSSIPKTHVDASDLGRIEPMGYARILTPDITRHLTWVNSRPVQETIDPKKTASGGGVGAKDGPEVDLPYPPPVGEDLHWLGLAVLLRKLLHPALISDAESQHLLVGMGEAVLPPLAAAENQQALKPWIDFVRGEVGFLPAKKPRILVNGKSPEEKMLLRLAAEDLASGYPCGLDGDFASRLLALDPEETVPLLIKYMEDSDHSFLRRNACSVLGNYLGDLPTGALVKAFESKDTVMKERAIDALARRRNTAILPALERYAVQKGLMQPFAIWALGAIGDPKGAVWCVKALAHTSDPDLLWAAIPAVARAQHDKPKDAISALRTLAKFLATAPDGTFDENAPLQADVPDPPGTKAMVLLEMAIIALARLGDEPAKKDLWKLLNDDADAPQPRNRRAAAHQMPVASKGTFGALHVPTLVLLMETLPSLGDQGRKRLETIALDQVCEISLRLQALDGLRQMKALTVAWLRPLVKDTAFPPVMARALRYTAELDAVEARKLALDIIRGYNGVFAGGPDTVAAIQFLATDKNKKVPVNLLSKSLEKAAKEAKAQAPGGNANANDRTITQRPPVLEEILKAMGLSNREEAIPFLVAHARAKDNAARASAVAALGGFANTRAALVSFLSDDDGWVRYTAYRVLRKKAPSLDAFADWMYGPPADRAAVVEKWKAWMVEEAVKAGEDPNKKDEPPKKDDPAKKDDPKKDEPKKDEPKKDDPAKKPPVDDDD
jgi:HEAT repeat protein